MSTPAFTRTPRQIVGHAVFVAAAALAVAAFSRPEFLLAAHCLPEPPLQDEPAQPVGTSAEAPPRPHDYETLFFEALNSRPDRRESALAAVRRRVATTPDDPRAVLLLGVAHLWSAAESPRDPAEAVEHLVLARHYLGRAAQLNPSDDRIPSWLLSTEISLAEAEGRTEETAAALAKLHEHAQRDPCFHSVAYAISVWDGPRDRDELAQAQKLLEAAAACSPDDPSVRNLSRWPHNVEGFLVGLSDLALKRGDHDRALAALVTAESWPGAERWPHLTEVQNRRRDFADRAARFADDDPSNDPRFIFERGGPVSCISCHQGATSHTP